MGVVRITLTAPSGTTLGLIYSFPFTGSTWVYITDRHTHLIQFQLVDLCQVWTHLDQVSSASLVCWRCRSRQSWSNTGWRWRATSLCTETGWQIRANGERPVHGGSIGFSTSAVTQLYLWFVRAKLYSQAFFFCYLSQNDGRRFGLSLLIHWKIKKNVP